MAVCELAVSRSSIRMQNENRDTVSTGIEPVRIAHTPCRVSVSRQWGHFNRKDGSMGLDISHDCFHGPYSQFMRWREWVAKQIGINLRMMEGFFLNQNCKQFSITSEDVPFEKWNALYAIHPELWDVIQCVLSNPAPLQWNDSDPLTKLLHHSDCDGRLKWYDAKPIALRLGQILRDVDDDTNIPMRGDSSGLPLWPDWRTGRGTYDGMVPCTKRFIVGLLKAFKAKEDVVFR